MKGSVHQRKNSKKPRWFVSIYWQSKRYKIRKHPITGEPFTSRESAEKQLGRIRTEIDEGYFNPECWKVSSPLLIREYGPTWLTSIDVSPNTLRGYSSAVNNYIVPFFGDKDIRHLRFKDIVKFHKWIKLTDKGKKNVVGTFKTMMRYAYKSEDILKVPPFPPLSYQEPEIVFLQFEQQAQILDAIPEHHRPIFQFMMESGCRPGEARALQKDCIKTDTITIKRAFSDNRLKETTKAKRVRHIPITESMREILKNLPLYLSPFVLTRTDGKPYTSFNLNEIWRKACEETGIKIKLYNGVRHSLGCQMVEMGAPLDVVRDQLGHQTSEMTRRYAKGSINVRKNYLEKRGKVVEFKKEANT
ncbi:tyrosine-type recombinase/integrase [Candidatus Latescibacterota bacterium]